MDKLPAELNCYITGYLLQDRAFFSVAALARCNRLLCSRVLPQLYDNVGRVDLQVGQDALIWAVENDELGTMKTLLERGVDPDARFYSTLPYPVRQDVFSAQRLQRRLAPNRDGHLANKIVQATMVTRGIYMMARERSESRLLPVWYLATVDGNIPDSLPVQEQDTRTWTGDDVAKLVKYARFNCSPKSSWLPSNRLHSWTALHLAVKRANSQAIDILLAHGADMEQKCQGLCDCLTPTCFYVSQGEQLPAWSPLHLAICSGDEHIVRLLLDLGADASAVGNVTERTPGATVDMAAVGITAMHSAALQGNVALCQLLLEHHAVPTLDDSLDRCARSMRRTTRQDMLEQRDSKGLAPLDYAVAAGHTQTTGAWLLDRHVDPLQHLALGQRDFLAPLNHLCFLGKYHEAQFLLSRIQCPPENYTLALQSCFFRPSGLAAFNLYPMASLRHFSDAYTSYAVSRERRPAKVDSDEALIELLKQLLGRGADPSAILDLPTEYFRHALVDTQDASHKSALHLAASRGRRAAVAVLLDAGATISPHCLVLPRRPADIDAEPLGLTPLALAMLEPLWNAPDSCGPTAFDQTISFLLEREVLLKNPNKDDHYSGLVPRPSVTPRDAGTHLRVSFLPLFWRTDAGDLDVWERILDMIARQEGKDHFPAAWAADVLRVVVTSKKTDERFCRWLAQRYNVTLSHFSSDDLEKMSPINFWGHGRFRDEAVMSWVLDFIPETGTEITLGKQLALQLPHVVSLYAEQDSMHAAKFLVERGLADKTSVGDGDEETCQSDLEERFRHVLFWAFHPKTKVGAAELVNAVLSRPLSMARGHPSNLLVGNREPLASRVIGNEGCIIGQGEINPEARKALKLILPHQGLLYGVKGRFHGERRPTEMQAWLDYQLHHYQDHPFFHPVSVAVDLGRADLLELVFQETAAPSHDDTLEVLAMALDVSWAEPNPAIVQTLLEKTPVDVSALIPRPADEKGNRNGVHGRVPPLYYLLKTFYNGHIIPSLKSSSPAALATTHTIHNCDCCIVTRDGFLVECVGLLVRRGASWLQPAEPSGETPLDVLADILDGEACGVRRGDWPWHDERRAHWSCHNWRALRRHVRIDWRAVGDGGGGGRRGLAEGFNPVEVGGLEARWSGRSKSRRMEGRV